MTTLFVPNQIRGGRAPGDPVPARSGQRAELLRGPDPDPGEQRVAAGLLHRHPDQADPAGAAEPRHDPAQRHRSRARHAAAHNQHVRRTH